MPLFLDTRGNSTLGIGICDRCARKFPIGELRRDPDSPGLLVCRDDLDGIDPYKLPQRKPESITLRNIRPDESVAITDYVLGPDGLPTEDDDGYYVEA